jgi:PncC family amidohydrolase
MTEIKMLEDRARQIAKAELPKPSEMNQSRKELVDCLHNVLVAKKVSVSLCESCTGGQASTWLVKHPHCSSYVKYNEVVYDINEKIEHLDIPRDFLDEFGQYSSQCAIAMAKGNRRNSGCTISVSITGVAGPTGGNELNPVGSFYVGVVTKEHAQAFTFDLSEMNGYDREEFIEAFAYLALRELLRFVLALEPDCRS